MFKPGDKVYCCYDVWRNIFVWGIFLGKIKDRKPAYYCVYVPGHCYVTLSGGMVFKDLPKPKVENELLILSEAELKEIHKARELLNSNPPARK